jgi:hypothetical protein
MREEGPVIRVRLPVLGMVWMGTTYHAVNDLLRDHARLYVPKAVSLTKLAVVS